MRKVVAAIAALFVLAVAGAFHVVAYTRTGVELLVAQVDRLQGIGLKVEGVTGRLTGPLRIARLELDHERVHVVLEDIVLDLHLRWLALQTIDITSARVASARVELKSAPDEPPPDRPLRFLPAFLRITIDQTDLAATQLTLQNGLALDLGHVTAKVRLRSDRILVDDAKVDGTLLSAAGSAELTAARPVGIAAKVSGTFFDGARPDLQLAAQLSGTAEDLGIEADLTAPATAHASVRITRPDNWQVAGHVSSPSFALAPWIPGTAVTLDAVDLDVTARPEGVSVAGQLTLPALGTPLLVNASGSYAQRTLTLRSFEARQPMGEARLSLDGTARFGDGLPDLDFRAAWQALQWPFAGSAPVVTSPSGQLQISGASPYRFTTAATINASGAPGVSGTATGTLSSEALALEQFNLSVLEGSVSGSGSLDWAAPRRWKLQATARGLNPVELHEELPGKIDMVVAATGTGTTPAADFSLSVERLRGVLRGQPLAGSGRAGRSAATWRFEEVDVSLGTARLAVAGTLARELDVRWNLSAPALAALWPDLSGRLQFSGSARGNRTLPQVSADVDAADLQFGDWNARSLTGHIDVDPEGATPSVLTIDARSFGRGDLRADSLRIRGNGTPASHTVQARLDSRAPRGTPIAAELDITGSYANATWSGQVASGRLVEGTTRQPVRLAAPATAVISRERASVTQLCLFLLDASVCGNGEWQRQGPWRFVAKGDRIPIDLVGELLEDQPEYLGVMSLDLAAEGSPTQPWRGDASIILTDAGIVYRLDVEDERSKEIVQVGSGRLDLRATADTLSAAAGVAVSAESFVAATATVTRQEGVPFGKSPLTGTLRGRMADANLLPVLVPEIDHASGVLTADLTMTGTVEAPQADGRIELAAGELDFYRINLALRNIALGLGLEDNRLQLAGTGQAGPGTWTVGGSLAWRNSEPSGTLTFKGENLLVSDLPEYRVVASPDLAFSINGRALRATGEVLIPSARIEPRDLSNAVQASPDSRLVGESPEIETSRYRVSSDIRIRLGNDVELKTFGLAGKLAGTVGTVMRPDEIPIGRGELSVSSGKYEAYGQSLDIARGRLLFDASPLDNPGLDIQAERRLESTKVGINVRGTLREPRFGFYSEPALSQTQILSYLLVGKPLDDLQNRDTAAVGSASNALAMQGGGILAAQLGRRIGLEAVGVESQGNNQTALVLGKFLSPRLFVSYGISLTESINTLKLRYTIADRWVLKTEAGEKQSADLEFTIERP